MAIVVEGRESMKPGERLFKARKAKKMTMDQLAELVGTSNQQISRLEKGQIKLTKEWAERLAPAVEVPAKSLLFGNAEPTELEKSVPFRTIPVSTLRLVGYVEAGAWLDISTAAFPEKEIQMPRDDRFMRARQFCLEVRGDSMNACKPIPILDGAILRCVDFAESGIELRTGQIAIVERTRDGGHLVEATVKRVYILPDRIELRPESTNPAHKPLLWNEETERTGETRVTAIVTNISYDLPKI
jgi:transcriptional regulator with XRE-family HTH domain